MRTWKKTISVLLSFAMLLSLCVVGAGATDGPAAVTTRDELIAALGSVDDGETITLGANITGDPININGYEKTFSIDKTSNKYSYPSIIGYYTTGANYYAAYGYGAPGVTMSHCQTYSGQLYTYTNSPIDDSEIAAYVARTDGTTTSCVYACTTLDDALAKVSSPYYTYVHLSKDFTETANTAKSTSFTLFPDGHNATGTIHYTGTSNYDVVTAANGDGTIDVSLKSITFTVANGGSTKRYATAELNEAVAYANECVGATTFTVLSSVSTTMPIALDADVTLSIPSGKTLRLYDPYTVNGTLENNGTICFYHGGSLTVPTGTELGTVTKANDSYVQTNSVSGSMTTYGISAEAAGEVSMKIDGGAYETYGTLGEAITAKGTSSDVTIQLRKSITVASGQKISNCTLDLNGFTLSTASGSYLNLADGTTTVTDTSEEKTGKITGGSSTRGLFNLQYTGNLTLEAGTFENTGSFSTIAACGRNSTATSNTTTIEIKSGAKLTSAGTGILIDKAASNKNCAGVTVNVYGEIEAADNDSAIYVNGGITDGETSMSEINVYDGAKISGGIGGFAAGLAEWNLYGGAITGATGMELRAGTLYIPASSTAVITGTGTFANAPNSNGATTLGAGIAVVQHTTKLPISVNLAGGTIQATGTNGIGLYQNDTQENGADEIAKIKMAVRGGSFSGAKALELNQFANLKTGSGVTGGTFSSDPTAFLASGCRVTGNNPFAVSAISSSGGSSAPVATPPAITAPTTSGAITTTTTTVKPITSGTTASATVPASTVDSAVTAAVDAAKESGTSPVVEVKVDAAPTATEVKTTLPVQALESVAESKAALTVSSPVATVSLPTAVVDKIAEAAGTGSVTLSVEKVAPADLTAAQQAAIGEAGDAVILDLSITAGNTRISELGGTVKISVPYTPTANEDMSKKVVWFIADDGTITPCEGSFDADTGTFTFQTTHFSTYILTDFPFTDVAAPYWAYSQIAWAYNNGYMNGKADTVFAPMGAVNRQQLWMVLARLSDAAPTNMAEARNWAVANNVSDGSNPEGAVSRQQMATMLNRYAALKNCAASGTADLTTFPDNAAVASYAADAMTWAVASGVIGGTSDGKLDPAGSTTRAQFAVMLNRFVASVIK